MVKLGIESVGFPTSLSLRGENMRKFRVTREDIESAINNGIFADNPVGMALQREFEDVLAIDLMLIEFEDDTYYSVPPDVMDFVNEWFQNGSQSVEPSEFTLI